jgi:phage terminase large subunit-like protein
VCAFFRAHLVHVKGAWAGQPFHPLAWQERFIHDLFDTSRADGLRQYRRAYLEIPRKAGKTSLCSGLALYLLTSDREPGAEIIGAATGRGQARIMLEIAKAMVRASPDLSQIVGVYRDQLVVERTESVYKVVSREAPREHGLNPHAILFDELWAQPDAELWEALITAQGARRQPLAIAITTAGYDRASLCWSEHQYAEAVRAGTVQDDAYLPVLYGAPAEADWTAPATWHAANPSLGETVAEAFYAAECQRAQQSPAYENTFRRLFLNQWTEQASRFLPLEAWRACGTRIDEAELVGHAAFGGLDLGMSDDLSAFVIVFLLPDGRVAVRARFWIPETTLQVRTLRPYAAWQRAGAVVVTQGNVTDLDLVEAEVAELCQQYAVREVAYDRRFASQLAQHLQGHGVAMIDQAQGYQLNEALRKLLELLQSGRLCHGGDPVLDWMAGNMVVRQGQQGELRPDKERATEKIDGIVALAMALERVIRQPRDDGGETSAYADHGLVIA